MTFLPIEYLMWNSLLISFVISLCNELQFQAAAVHFVTAVTLHIGSLGPIGLIGTVCLANTAIC